MAISYQELFNNANQSTHFIANKLQENRQQVEQDAANLGLDLSDPMQLAQYEEFKTKHYRPFEKTPMELQRERLHAASERQRERLTGEKASKKLNQEIQMRARGFTNEEIEAWKQNSEQLEQMSEEERIDHFAKGGEDYELQDAILNNTEEEIDLLYQDKPNLAHYAKEMRRRNVHSANTKATARTTDSSAETMLNWNGLGSTILSGTAETTMAVEGLVAINKDDPEERLRAFADLQEGGNSVTGTLLETANDIKTQGQKASDLRAQGQKERRELLYDREVLKGLSQGLTKEDAQMSANIEVAKQALADYLTNAMQIQGEALEFIPDILMAIGTGGATAIAKNGVEGVIKHQVDKQIARLVKEAGDVAYKDALQTMAKDEAKKVAVAAATKKFAEVGATAAAKKEAKVQALKEAWKPVTKVTVTAQQAITSALQNAPEGYQNASEAILGMDASVVANSPKGQELKAQNPDLTDKQIQRLLADTAGAESYKGTAIATGLISILGGYPEAKLASKIFDGGVGSVGKYATSVGLNAVSQGAEESAISLVSNKSANTALGENRFDVYKGAGESFVQGALSSGATTAITNTPELFGSNKNRKSENNSSTSKKNNAPNNTPNTPNTGNAGNNNSKPRDTTSSNTSVNKPINPDVESKPTNKEPVSRPTSRSAPTSPPDPNDPLSIFKGMKPKYKYINPAVGHTHEDYYNNARKQAQLEIDKVNAGNSLTSKEKEILEEYNAIVDGLKEGIDSNSNLTQMLASDLNHKLNDIIGRGIKSKKEVLSKTFEINKLYDGYLALSFSEKLNKIPKEDQPVFKLQKLVELRDSDFYSSQIEKNNRLKDSMQKVNLDSVSINDRLNTDNIETDANGTVTVKTPSGATKPASKFVREVESIQETSDGNFEIKQNDGTKQKFTKEEVNTILKDYVLSMNTKKTIPLGQEQKILTESIKELKELSSIAEKFNKAIKAKDSSLGTFIKATGRLVNSIGELTDGISAEEAATLQGILFGDKRIVKGKDYNSKGLLTYLQEYLSNDNKLDVNSSNQLASFLHSQQAKLTALSKLKEQWEEDRANNNAQESYTLTIDGTKSENRSGGTINFHTLKKLNAYIKRTKRLEKEIQDLMVDLLDESSLVKFDLYSKSKAKAKSDSGSKTSDTTEFDMLAEAAKLQAEWAMSESENEGKKEEKQDNVTDEKTEDSVPEEVTVTPEVSLKDAFSEEEQKELEEKSFEELKEELKLPELNLSNSHENKENQENKQQVVFDDSNEEEEDLNQDEAKDISKLSTEQKASIKEVIESSLVESAEPVEGKIEEEDDVPFYSSAISYINQLNYGLIGFLEHTGLSEDYIAPIRELVESLGEEAVHELTLEVLDALNSQSTNYFHTLAKNAINGKGNHKPANVMFNDSPTFTDLLKASDDENNPAHKKGIIADAIGNLLFSFMQQFPQEYTYKNAKGYPQAVLSKPKMFSDLIETHVKKPVSHMAIADVSIKANSSFNLRTKLIHDLINQPNNKKKIAEESKERSSKDNYPETYTLDGEEYSIPMWLANELSLRGLSLKEDLSKQFKEGSLHKDALYKFYDNILEGDFVGYLEAIGESADNELAIRALQGIKEQAEHLQEHFTEQVFTMLKNSSIDFRIGASGLLNIVHIDKNDVGELEISFPKEFMVAMLKGTLYGYSVFNMHAASSGDVTEEFLEEKGIYATYNVSEGFYKAKQILSTGYNLGSNKDHLSKDIGSFVLSQFGIEKDSAQNTLLGLQSLFGNEIINFMHENNLTNMYRASIIDTSKENVDVSIYDPNNETKGYTFVQAKWNVENTDILKGSVKDLIEYTRTNSLDKLLGVTTEEITHQIIFHKDEPQVLNSNKQKTEFTSGQSSDLTETLHVFNNQTWQINTDMFTVVENFGDLYGLATEVVEEEAILTDRSRQSAKSNEHQYRRNKENFLASVKSFLSEKGNQLKDWRMKGEYEITSNMRVMMKSLFNPQNIKFFREILDLVQYNDKGEEEQYSFVVSNANRPTEFNQLGKKILESNDKDMFMFGLALAQALGVKIEKLSYRKIFTQLDEKLSSETISNMYELVSQARTKSVDSSANREAVIAFRQEFGNGGHRAIKGLMYLNQMMNSDGNFSPNLFIEADGIGNGMHNIFMQFSTSLSEALFKTLTKTGVITLDRIATLFEKREDKSLNLEQFMDTLEGSAHIFSEDLSDAVPKDAYEDISDTMVQQLQGSFTAIQEGINLYNEMVGKVAISPEVTLDDLSSMGIYGAITWMQEQLENDSNLTPSEIARRKNVIRGMKNSITSVTVLTLSGDLKHSNGNLLGVAISDLASTVNSNLITEMKASISRAFAKAGVTPATYGGKLNGIANQLLKNFVSDITHLGDTILQDLHNDDYESLNQNLKLFLSSMLTVGLLKDGNLDDDTTDAFGSENNFVGLSDFLTDDAKELEQIIQGLENRTKAGIVSGKEQFKADINEFINRVSLKAVVSENIKYSVASLLNDAVGAVYGEALEVANKTLALSGVLFEEFIEEFTDTVQDAVDKRNLDKGWAKRINGEVVITDSRGHNSLTKREYKDIFKTMRTLPVVATAFSDDAELLSELVRTGNSLVKLTRDDGLYATSYSMYKNSRLKANLGVTISATVKKYMEAGASIFTSTVVSTESKSQTETQKRLHSEGKASLDVYDGNDAYIWMAFLVGDLMNKNSFDAHQNYSVMEAMYRLYSQSGLAKVANLPPFNGKKAPTTLTPDVKKQLVMLDGLIKLGTISDKDGILYENIQKALTEKDQTKVKASLASVHKFIGGNLNSKFQMGMDSLAIMVAERTATMAVLNKVPLKYNQFAGANRGVTLNADSELAKRLIDAAVNKNLNPKNLGKFLLSDPELQKLYKDTKEKTLKNLLKNNDKSFKIPSGSDSKAVIENTKKRLLSDASTKNSVKHKVLHAILHASSDYISEPIFTNKQAFIEAYKDFYSNLAHNLQAHYLTPEEFEKQLDSSEALYQSGVGVYVPEDSSEETLVHELLHAGTLNALWDVIVNKNSNPKVEHSIQSIKTTIKKLRGTVRRSTAFYELLEEFKNSPNLDVNLAYARLSSLEAALLNFELAFETYPKLVQTGQITERELNEMQALALSEFISYSLTENTDILALQQTERARFNKQRNGILTDILNAIIAIRQTIAKMFGIDMSNSLVRSELFSVLENAINLMSVNKTLPDNVKAKAASKTRLESNIDNNGNISSKHKAYLKDIITSFKQLTSDVKLTNTDDQVGDYLEYPHLAAQIKTNNSDIPMKLRGLGFSISSEEEDVFDLVYSALNMQKAAKNSSVFNDFSKIINELTSLKPRELQGITSRQLEDLLSVSSKDTTALIALMISSEQIKDAVERSVKNIGKSKVKFKTFRDDIVANVRSSEDLNTLAQDIFRIDLKNIPKVSALVRREINNANKDAQDNQINSKILEFTGGIPLVKYIGDALISINSGKDLQTYERGETPTGESSIIGSLIDSIVNWDIERKNRTTALSKIISYFRGESPDMHIVGEMHASHVIRTDVVRQRQRGMFTNLFRGLLSEVKNSDESLAIKHIMRTELAQYVNQNPNFDFAELTDKYQIQLQIERLEQGLKDIIDLEINATPKAKTQLFNYLRWQYQGLADLQMNNSAKGNISHDILPNTKAIAALNDLDHIMTFTKSDVLEDLLKTQLDQLTTLKAIHNMDKEAFDNLNQFIKDNSKGINKILSNTLILRTNDDSYLGRTGYMHFSHDPDFDVQIADTEERRDELKRMGYREKAELSDGTIVMSSDGAARNQYTTGVFSFTERTVNGVNISNYGISGIVSKQYDLGDAKIINKNRNASVIKALNNPNYYENLEKISNLQPMINEEGYLIGYESSVPYQLQEELLPTKQDSIDNLASMYSRDIEEKVVAKENINYFNQLKELYEKHPNKKQFIKVDGKLEAKGNRLDKKFIKDLNNFYNQLPQETKAHIEKNGGLYIPIKEVDNIVGYHKWNLSDVFTNRSNFPEPIRLALKGILTGMALAVGQNPVKFTRALEQYTKEIVSLGKDYILNRSMIVPTANLISNAIHLVQWGISPKEIPSLIKEGYIAAKQYQKTIQEIDKIRLEMKTASPSKVKALQTRANVLQSQLQSSLVQPLIQSGLLTSISSFELEDAKADYSKLGKLSDKIGLTKIQNELPTAFKELLVRDGSTVHDTLSEFMNYGDFVSKYALYKHLLRQGKTEYHALNIVREEFIDYSRNRGAFFDMLNSYGLTYFLNYKLAIQKIIFRSFRRNFLRTAAVMSSDSFIPAGLDPLDLYQTVPTQMMGIGHVIPFGSYQTSPHLIDAFESHYLVSLTKALL